jgi:serine/threonine protein kinase
MGVVYRAYDKRLNRSIALKVVSPHLAETADYRDRFISEARSAASVEHRGIVPIFEVDEDAGQLYIAMRLIDGEDLAAYAKRRAPMSVAEALRVLAPIAEALDAAAKRGLVHRDVKPSNILVADPEAVAPEVLLSDFGLAKTQGDAGRTQTGQFVGSVDYVAPEQIATGIVDGRADQYALACVFYELLTGTPPFRRDQPMQTLFAQVNDPIPAVLASRPELPAKIDVALARGLAKNPDDRYGTTAGMLNAIAAAAGESPVASESSTSMPIIPSTVAVGDADSTPNQPAGSRRPLVLGGAVLLLIVAIAIGFFATRSGTGDSASQPAATATATSGEDAAALQEQQAAALRKAYELQAEFTARAEALILTTRQCNREAMRSAKDGGDCVLESTRIAEQKALTSKATEAGRQLPALLDLASVGDSDACRSAVDRFDKDERTMMAAFLRAMRADRQAEYDQWDIASLTAWVKYRELASQGTFAPIFVNQFAVEVACAPSANWPISTADAAVRLDALRGYYEARSRYLLGNSITDYCYGLVGGTVSGSDDDTTVKTCAARYSDPQGLLAEKKKLANGFGSLVAMSSWSDLSSGCRASIKQAFNVVEKMVDYRAQWDTALSNNEPDSVLRDLKTREGDLDMAKLLRSEARLAPCLTPKSSEPS